MMFARRLGQHECSILGMGCSHIGNSFDGKPPLDGKRGRELVRYALSVGITLFDTAEDYGMEVADTVRKAGAILCRKTDAPPMRGSKGEREIWLRQYKRGDGLNLPDQFDGFSCYSPDTTERIVQSRLASVIQVPFNLLDRRHAFAFGEIGVIVRSVLLRGKLASMADEAIRFAAYSGADCVLIGFRSEIEIDIALEAVSRGPIHEQEIIDPRRWDA